jgi:hypothetical protein
LSEQNQATLTSYTSPLPKILKPNRFDGEFKKTLKSIGNFAYGFYHNGKALLTGINDTMEYPIKHMLANPLLRCIGGVDTTKKDTEEQQSKHHTAAVLNYYNIEADNKTFAHYSTTQKDIEKILYFKKEERKSQGFKDGFKLAFKKFYFYLSPDNWHLLNILHGKNALQNPVFFSSIGVGTGLSKIAIHNLPQVFSSHSLSKLATSSTIAGTTGGIDGALVSALMAQGMGANEKEIMSALGAGTSAGILFGGIGGGGIGNLTSRGNKNLVLQKNELAKLAQEYIHIIKQQCPHKKNQISQLESLVVDLNKLTHSKQAKYLNNKIIATTRKALHPHYNKKVFFSKQNIKTMLEKFDKLKQDTPYTFNFNLIKDNNQQQLAQNIIKQIQTSTISNKNNHIAKAIIESFSLHNKKAIEMVAVALEKHFNILWNGLNLKKINNEFQYTIKSKTFNKQHNIIGGNFVGNGRYIPDDTLIYILRTANKDKFYSTPRNTRILNTNDFSGMGIFQYALFDSAYTHGLKKIEIVTEIASMAIAMAKSSTIKNQPSLKTYQDKKDYILSLVTNNPQPGNMSQQVTLTTNLNWEKTISKRPDTHNKRISK